MKNRNIKMAVTAGIVGVSMMGALGSPTYALEASDLEPAALAEIMSDAPVEPTLTEAEARQGATELVNMIRRLELTPEYQKMDRLITAINCRDFDISMTPQNIFSCEAPTSDEELRAAIQGVLADDDRDLVDETENIDQFDYQRNIPWFGDWYNVVLAVKYTYYAPKYWSLNDNLGITRDLTVDNIAKIMQRTGSIYYLGNYNFVGDFLKYFWNNLAILQNTDAGRIARIYSKIEGDRWMRLVQTVYWAEEVIYGDGHTSVEGVEVLNDLLAQLNYFVGYIPNSTSISTVIGIAKDLSEYAQAKALFDEINKVCPQFNADGSPSYSVCFTALNAEEKFTAEERAVLADRIEMLATILYPTITEGLFDYQLTLATIDEPNGEIPATPNTGEIEDGEMSGMIVKITVTGIALAAAIAGAMVTVKRYAFSPLRRRK